MENDVLEMLETLYAMVSEAWGVPLGNDKCIIEREKVLNALDDIKAKLPVELAEAKRLVSAKEEFIERRKVRFDIANYPQLNISEVLSGYLNQVYTNRDLEIDMVKQMQQKYEV